MRDFKYYLISLILLLVFITGCSGNNSENSLNGNTVAGMTHTVNIGKLEIYHFHGTQQCYSCKTVGAYAEETVKTYFKDELNSGKIVFGHINRELPENNELVVKYSPTGSSLWIGVYDKEGNFHKEENVNVWYKIKDKQDYMSYLKEIIEKRFAGDLS